MMKIPDNDEDTCIGKCKVAAWKRWKKKNICDTFMKAHYHA